MSKKLKSEVMLTERKQTAVSEEEEEERNRKTKSSTVDALFWFVTVPLPT